jgi:macrolide transport system ATP-binding/permease protein
MFRRKRRSFEDLQAEIESHLQMEADEIRDTAAAGESLPACGGLDVNGAQSGRPAPLNADSAARRNFGNITALEERWYESGRWTLFGQLGQELRNGMRLIKRGPGFSLFVILTLAMGIGATSTILSVAPVSRRP